MKIIHYLSSLFFPKECPGCGEFIVENESAICLGCMCDLRPAEVKISDKKSGLFCRIGGKVPLEGAYASFYFEKKGKMKKIIQALKYRRMPEVGTVLGKYMGAALKADADRIGFECIIPVPLHSSRQAERGYNQAEEIAKGISVVTGIPVDTGIMAKRSGTVSQTRNGKSERWKNVSDVFQRVGPVKGRVLIVDDVVTTGSTLEACIRELVRGQENEIEVYIAAVAMASHD